MNDSIPKWIKESKVAAQNLDCLLEFASDNYNRHTDWYLRHREIGIRMLTLLLTAEFAIIGFYYTAKFKVELTILALSILSILALILTYLSFISCRQSYMASLENALLVTKIIWSKGLTKPIAVKIQDLDLTQCPVQHDETPYVPRYLRDAKKYLTTDDFVKVNMSKRGTTYFATKYTLIVMGILAFFVGIGGIIVVIVFR